MSSDIDPASNHVPDVGKMAPAPSMAAWDLSDEDRQIIKNNAGVFAPQGVRAVAADPRQEGRHPMKLRIIKPEGLYAVGDVIEPDMPDVSRMLIARGIAEPIPEEPEAPATGAFTAPNKAMRRERVRSK